MGQDALRLVEVVNVMSLYEEGALRSENYDRAVETIMDAVDLGKTLGMSRTATPWPTIALRKGWSSQRRHGVSHSLSFLAFHPSTPSYAISVWTWLLESRSMKLPGWSPSESNRGPTCMP